MIVFNLLIAYFVGGNGDCRIEKLTPELESQFIDIYGIVPNPSGTQISGRIWEDTQLPTDPHLAHGLFLVLKMGFCVKWTLFTIDRMFHWHEGQAAIDMIHPNGTHVRECLGSTLRDADCKYAVAVPRDWYAVIRMTKDLAVATIAAINGDIRNGTNIEFSFMMDEFGSCHSDLIEKTERCFEA